MISEWYELKPTAVALRQQGISMTVIERKLGVPRSTLSGWFKDIVLSDEQKLRLAKSKSESWQKARQSARSWHSAQKSLRLLDAKQQALEVMDNIPLTAATLDLAFSFLYLNGGAKSKTTSLASTNPNILKFVLAVLRHNYAITGDMVRCELQLRADQSPIELKKYWSKELRVPVAQFRSVYIDQRSAGNKSYENYKGVCVLYCGSIAIQRKLMYLYNLFCEKVTNLELGD